MGGSSSKKNPLGLSDVDVECFKATFDAFDVVGRANLPRGVSAKDGEWQDGGGSIDAAELKGLLNAFGVVCPFAQLQLRECYATDPDRRGARDNDT